MSDVPTMYLTIGQTRTTDGVLVELAVISLGSPQFGDRDVEVLTLETFPFGTPRKEMEEWYRRMKVERPWETRQ